MQYEYVVTILQFSKSGQLTLQAFHSVSWLMHWLIYLYIYLFINLFINVSISQVSPNFVMSCPNFHLP